MNDKPEDADWIAYINSISDPIEMLKVILTLPEHLTDPKHAESGAAIKSTMEAIINDAETRRSSGDPWHYDPYTRTLADRRKTDS